MAKTATKTATKQQKAGLESRIRHLEGCPQERNEIFTARRPGSGAVVTVARCIDCGDAAVEEGAHD